ncbi:MAG: hypothetical protein ACI9D5_001523 [Candidatus Endobugula sp.]|jgi:hypothetical protein
MTVSRLFFFWPAGFIDRGLVMTIKAYIRVLVSVIAISLSAYVSAGWFDKLAELVGNNVSSEDVSSVGKAVSKQALSTEDISGAFKQALELGSQRVVDQLGKADGFNNDSLIHIPLPEQMQTVKKWLDKVGMGGSLDSLELSLNRAAENAVPKAKALFEQTIKQMTFDDVKSIYNGSDDAATRYFQAKMTPALSTEMQPVVQQSLSEVGAVKLYDDVMGDYQSIPFVPDIKADLVDHVVKGGLNGIFHYLAKEEAEIRQNPIRRTTELLKKVFGAK